MSSQEDNNNMPDYTVVDRTEEEPTVLQQHPEVTTPQGTQFDGVMQGHEHRDASVRSIVGWFTAMVCFILVVSVAVSGVFFTIIRHEESKDTVPSASFKSSVKLAPMTRAARMFENEQADEYLPTATEPLALMPMPHKPMIKLRKEEEAEVNSYGYVKDAEGKKVGVHIPIDDAIELSLKRGFRVAATPTSIRPSAPVSPALEPAEDKGF